VFMFKALLQQIWYSLSDPKLERLLVRDLLFRRFVVSNGMDSSSPDKSAPMRQNKPNITGRRSKPRIAQDLNVNMLQYSFFCGQITERLD
jgi:hypothetical protein